MQALIVEECGGVASTGMFKGAFHRLLELVPEDVHERCPVIVGCQLDFYRFTENKWEPVPTEGKPVPVSERCVNESPP